MTFAISWYPEIRGVLVVVIGVSVLMGSVFLLLSTNVGARLGMLLALTALSGWIMLMATVWWVYGIGLKGTDPSWKPVAVVDGDIGSAPGVPDYAKDLSIDWKLLDEADPGRGQAQAAADEILINETKRFAATTEYKVLNVHDKGGKTWPRFINLLHRPHYAVVEVQPTTQLPAEPGKAAPQPTIDTSRDPVYVIMIRDLGHRRRPAALIAMGSALLFAVFCSMLHSRDKLIEKNLAEVPAGA